MDELRWILLLIGLALVAGIYFFGRRRSARDESLLDAAHDIQVSDGAGPVRRPVEDDSGEAIAYSEDALKSLAVSAPALFRKLLVELSGVFNRTTEERKEAEKKSAEPSSEYSESAPPPPTGPFPE